MLLAVILIYVLIISFSTDQYIEETLHMKAYVLFYEE